MSPRLQAKKIPASPSKLRVRSGPPQIEPRRHKRIHKKLRRRLSQLAELGGPARCSWDSRRKNRRADGRDDEFPGNPLGPGGASLLFPPDDMGLRRVSGHWL